MARLTRQSGMMNKRAWLTVTLCLFLMGHVAPASGAQATITAEVPPGKWQALRLRNLPSGAFVAVDLETSGEVGVVLVGAADYRRFPTVVRPLFRGVFEHRLSFSVTIPAAGNYFVVFDNRSAAERRNITATVAATRGDQVDAVQTILDLFERQLHRLFVFEPIAIRVQRCGTANAFSRPSGVVLCAEYAKKIFDTLGDKTKVSDALVFTLFHELGHVLLAQWNYPFFENEEVADEFATALMLMLGQQERVRAKAEYFAANPSVAEAIAKAFRDDRHPLSGQRARNILRWLNDPQLVRKWQKVFVPHMQTAALERLAQQPTNWTDRGLVEKELATRR